MTNNELHLEVNRIKNQLSVAHEAFEKAFTLARNMPHFGVKNMDIRFCAVDAQLFSLLKDVAERFKQID